MKVYVEGIGLRAPGLEGWQGGREILAGHARYAFAPLVFPVLDMLPSAERRRVGVPVKIALTVGIEAVKQSGRAAHDLPTVFASASGDPDNVHAICESLAGAEREISPTRFHNSVHNAPSGYWSIAMRAPAASTSLARFDESFAVGLLEAAVQASVEHDIVALMAYDAPYPPPMRALRPGADAFGVSLVLARTPSAQAVAELDIVVEASPAQPDACADADLERLRLGSPAARCLPLLEAIARRQTRDIAIAWNAGQPLKVRVTPC